MPSAVYKNSQLTHPLLLRQMLQSLNYSHGPLLDLPCPSCTGEPQTGHRIHTCFIRAKRRSKSHSTSSPAGNALPGCICRMQPRMSLVFAMRVHCWLMVNLFSRPPWGFLCTTAFQLVGPQPMLVHGVTPLPDAGLRTYPFWTPQDSWQPIAPAWWGPFELQHKHWLHRSFTPSFVSPANLLRVHFISSSKSLMKMLNSTGPSIQLCGVPLVTGLQLVFIMLVTAL